MLFKTLLPWVVVLYLREKDNDTEVMLKNITRSLDEDLRDLCTNKIWHIKKVELYNEEGNLMRRWLMKFYFEDVNSDGSGEKILRELVSINSKQSENTLNLSLCSDSNTLLLHKLEITRFISSRSRRSSNLNNSLQQTWSSEAFEQTYKDEKGLEITVKVPRGGGIATAESQHHHHKPKVGGEREESLTLDTTMKTTQKPSSSTSTSHPLSERCQRFKNILESVQFWTYARLTKMEKGEITDTECSSSIPIR